jgi:hypothetical protein
MHALEGSKGYPRLIMGCKHDRSDPSIAGNRSTYIVSDEEPLLTLRYLVAITIQLSEEGGQWWELCNVASERVEDTDEGVFVPLE